MRGGGGWSKLGITTLSAKNHNELDTSMAALDATAMVVAPATIVHTSTSDAAAATAAIIPLLLLGVFS